MFNRSTYGFSRNRIYKWPALWIQPFQPRRVVRAIKLWKILRASDAWKIRFSQAETSPGPSVVFRWKSMEHHGKDSWNVLRENVVVRIASRKTNMELQQWSIFLTDFPDVKLKGSYPTRRRVAWKASLDLAGGWSAGYRNEWQWFFVHSPVQL